MALEEDEFSNFKEVSVDRVVDSCVGVFRNEVENRDEAAFAYILVDLWGKKGGVFILIDRVLVIVDFVLFVPVIEVI